MRRTTEINNEVRSIRNRSRKPRYQRLSKEEGATGARDNILFIRVTSFCACLPKMDSNKFGGGNYASIAFGTIISLRSARRCRVVNVENDTIHHIIRQAEKRARRRIQPGRRWEIRRSRRALQVERSGLIRKRRLAIQRAVSPYHILTEIESKRVLISTAIVDVRGGNSQLRVLLDSASETNFITQLVGS